MSVIDIARYRKKEPLKSPLERCVSCWEVTDVLVNKPISERRCYVPGVGQLCERCCIALYGTRDLRSLDDRWGE